MKRQWADMCYADDPTGEKRAEDEAREYIADLWKAHRALMRRVEELEKPQKVDLVRWDADVTYTHPGRYTVIGTLGSNGDGP